MINEGQNVLFVRLPLILETWASRQLLRTSKELRDFSELQKAEKWC